MDDGWNRSAQAWIASMGDDGDWSRQHVLDPAMLKRVEHGHYVQALDVGCGEGRFCRKLKQVGIDIIGVDATAALVDAAIARDPDGDYRLGRAEDLAFESGYFDLVISYLALIDIEDYRGAIAEMARVLRPGGTLLIANMNSFVSAAPAGGWTKDEQGASLHFIVDNYLDEWSDVYEWSGIRIRNWHRPMEAYFSALLENGLRLVHFSEPEAVSGDAERKARHRRVPWFVVMEWIKPSV